MAGSNTRKALLRPLLIMGAFAVGIAFPQAACLRGYMRYILMLMLFFIFSKLDFSELKPRRQHWMILAANLVLPLILFFGLSFFGLRDLALAAFFTAVTPTATAAPVILSFMGGNINFVVSCFIITNLGIIGALFFLIPLLVTGKSDAAEFIRVGINLAVTMIVPAVIAQLTRKLMPAGEVWKKRLNNLNFSLWVVLLVIIAANATDFILKHREVPLRTLLAIGLLSMVICAINFAGGYLLGGRKFKQEASQGFGQKNTTLTIVLATTFASPLVALGPTIYVLWHNVWNACQLYMFERRRSEKEEVSDQ